MAMVDRGQKPGSMGADLLTNDGGVSSRLWGRRAFWQVWLRWWVPPGILIGLWVGDLLGFQMASTPILFTAGWTLLYNVILAVFFSRTGRNLSQESDRDRIYAIIEVALDYTAMFMLMFCTGGVGSPLIFFFLFHIIFAAIHFPSSTAWLFAVLTAFGLWGMVLAERLNWFVSFPLSHAGAPLSLQGDSVRMMVFLGFFTLTLFIVAGATTKVTQKLRDRVALVYETSQQIAQLNERLHSIYSMLVGIGTERNLEPILEITTRELTKTMGVRMSAVKLQSEDGKHLYFKAGYGLPESLLMKEVDLSISPYNRRAMRGETQIFGNVEEAGYFQLKGDFEEIGIKSVLFAPLWIEKKVIGVLSVYCIYEDRFDLETDGEFIQLVSELVALAIDSANAYEEIQDLMTERQRYTMQVAHNMRAPLAASLGMLDLISDGMLGEVSQKQRDAFSRIQFRLKTLNHTVSQLLTLSQTRDMSLDIVDVRIDLHDLARNLRDTFNPLAAGKNQILKINVDSGLRKIDSGADLLQQLMENLISNAIKYTPQGGKVEVSFSEISDERVKIRVKDNGVGVPEADQNKLFTDFFRASNARKLQELGSGLGLALVKQTVIRHGGEIKFKSKEGVGTTFTVTLPLTQPG